ncbi:hypothetical protein [Aequorivita sp. KMM 9714]|uniref:hypothetical protein n=1 Tax=Aequorivita sp. KMM 9714 TaxID=2707173 RepID=UPI0013EB6C6C|nr:hypothetical protein [Aequorivita sp. KMM 9714]NGX83087.1 hypothetical protein [Aequorivita sp. KMM 9714]
MKNLILLLFLAISTYSFSQIEERKGKLFFKLGSEYRITPLSYDGNKLEPSLSVEVDAQNSGVSFHYGFDYFITKNLSIGFNNSFRYDILISNTNEIDNDFGVQKADKTLMIGGHLYLDYHVKVFKNSELFARIGRSILNGGTHYVEKKTYYDNQGNTLGSSYTTNDFQFSPANFAIGFKKDKVELIIGMYASTQAPYFDETESLKIPYINFTYTIGKLWK